MRTVLPIILAMILAPAGSGMAQTINGESNYEDGFSHIPPQAEEPPPKGKPAADGSSGGNAGKLGAPPGK